MSIYLGNQLIAGDNSSFANQDLSNLSATGQAVIDGKADTSLSNINSTAKIAISHNAMPSARYIGLNLLPSMDTYTAPSDGWIYISGTQYNYSGYVFVENVSNGMCMVSQPTNTNNFEIRAFIPVAKGQTYKITYGDVYIYVFRFIYNIGSESEAN